MVEVIGLCIWLVIINILYNFSGVLISCEELDCLVVLICDWDIYLISDEVYEYLVFDGVVYISVLFYDELYLCFFVVSLFGKIYYVIGWKIGYVVVLLVFSVELCKVYQYVNFCGVMLL